MRSAPSNESRWLHRRQPTSSCPELTEADLEKIGLPLGSKKSWSKRSPA
jgi:hypothetical protein